MNRRTSLVVSVLFLVVISAFLATALPAWAQSTPARTLGILHRDLRAYDGYTLYKNLGDKYVYLLNNAGNPVHNWKIPIPTFNNSSRRGGVPAEKRRADLDRK